MSDKQFFVYILASGLGGTLYVGVTSRLIERIWEHRNAVVEGFTKRHDIHRLVWFEAHQSAESAIIREKHIKAWKRAWKISLIEQSNPNWEDISSRLTL